MRISVGVAALLILTVGIGGLPGAKAQDAPGEPADGDKVEETGAPRDLQIGDFVYRLGQGLPLGALRIHPYAAEYVVYDDNVFLIEEDEPGPDGREKTTEISSETTLGFRADLPFADHYASGEYRVQFVNYLLEGTPNLIRHLARAQIRLDFNRVYGEVTNTYRNTDDPVDLPDLGRFRRATDFLDARGGVKLEKLGFEAGAHARYYDFFESETNYLDHNEIFVHGKVFYDATPKFTLYGQGEYGTVAFGDDESRASSSPGAGFTLNDYTYIRIWAGTQYRPGQKFALHGRVGFMSQAVDEGDPPNTDDEEFQGLLAGFGMAYAAAEKIKLSLGYLRDLQFSGTGNFQIVDRIDGRLDLQPTPKLLTSGIAFLENSDPSATDSFQRVGFGAILDYRMLEWLSIGFQYQYRQRLAQDIGDYTNNRFLGNVTVYF